MDFSNAAVRIQIFRPSDNSVELDQKSGGIEDMPILRAMTLEEVLKVVSEVLESLVSEVG